MPWAPGESGNPNGAPKNQKRFMAALERAMAQDSGKLLRAAAEKLLDLAAAGEPWAIKELADRLDGKPVQQIAADTDGGAIAIALVAYHPAQLQPEAIPAPGPTSLRLGHQEDSSGLAS